MERTMKKVVQGGIEWMYRPKVVCTAMYRGWNINIRYCAPMDWMAKSGPKRNWRLSVTRNGGGSIAFDHQFFTTLKEAKLEGVALVDGHPATPKSVA